MILKSGGEAKGVQKFIEHNLERMEKGYHRLLGRVLAHRIWVMLVAVLVFASLYPLFALIKSELAPSEDQGAIVVQTTAPASVNPDYQEFYHNKVSDALSKVPDAASWFVLAGTPTLRQGTAIAVMKPWHERTVSFDESFVVARQELEQGGRPEGRRLFAAAAAWLRRRPAHAVRHQHHPGLSGSRPGGRGAGKAGQGQRPLQLRRSRPAVRESDRGVDRGPRQGRRLWHQHGRSRHRMVDHGVERLCQPHERAGPLLSRHPAGCRASIA